MKTKTKLINYAYGTSITANKFNKHDGCWLVETGEGEYCPCVSHQTAYDTEREAIDAAYAIDLPWCGMWINFVNPNHG